MAFISRSLRAGAGVFLVVSSLAGAASAVTYDVTINGELISQHTWNRILGSVNGFLLSGRGTDVAYQAFQISITNAATFLAETLYIGGVRDTTITLYSGTFDPADPLTNAVFYDDDGGVGLYSLIDGSTDGPFPEGQYTIVISTFLNGDTGVYTLVMNGVVVGWGLLAAAQMEELKAHAAVSSLEISSATSATVFNAVKQALANRQGDGMATVSTQGSAPGTAVRPWISLEQTVVENDSLSYRFPTIQVGVDMAVGSNMVAGLSLSRSELSAETTGSDLSGRTVTLQPYIGYQFGDATANAGLVLGRSDYSDLTSTGGTGSAKGEIRALSFAIENPYQIGSNTLTAHFDILHGRTRITDAAGSLAGAADQTIKFTHASLGGNYAVAMAGGVVTFGASLDYDDTDAPALLAGPVYSDNGFSGTLSVGARYRMGGGGSADIALELGGIGSDVRRLSAGLGVDIRF